MIDRPTQQQQSADHLAAQRATNRLAAEVHAARTVVEKASKVAELLRGANHGRTHAVSPCPWCELVRVVADYNKAVAGD